MNKLKEQLMVALSEEVDYKDFDNSYNVVIDFCLSFLTFLREKCVNYDFDINEWELREDYTGKQYTDKEILNKFLEEYEQ